VTSAPSDSTPGCSRPFDEALLSGYLDGSLTQAQGQRVRLHVEDCAECRREVAELRLLRESTMGSRFRLPDEAEWPELPRTRLSWLSRGAGWMAVVAWLVVVTAVALYRFLSATGDPLEIFVVLGLPGGVALLFVSVLLDRIRDLRTDRYKGIQR
jgi:anti-sigma factor RsiW